MKNYEKPEDKTSRVDGMLDKLQDAPKGKLKGIHIEPADNGFSVRVHRDLPPKPAPEQAEGDGSDQATAAASLSGQGETNSVFTNPKHALAHIKKHMGIGAAEE